MQWQQVAATVVRGHSVASGANNNPRFPGGTLRMQTPHFLERGLDLNLYHIGTINVSIAPRMYRVRQPKLTFRNVQWHPTEPMEDFSFFDVRLTLADTSIDGLIYYPHPDTKPEHFQSADVLELLLPFVKGIAYGKSLTIATPMDQMVFE